MNSTGFVGGSLKLKGNLQSSKVHKQITKTISKDSKKKDKKSHKKHDKKDHKKKKHSKRKHSSSSSESDSEDSDSSKHKSSKNEEVKIKEVSITELNIPQGLQETSPVKADHFMTESERRYQEVQRQRQQQRIQDKANKNHREKIEEFNKRLSKLPEHFDIPKVGPG